jgi:hypothetical protein
VRYLKAFAVAAPLGILVAHYVPDTPMPWYPDAVIFGGFMGAMTAFIVMRLTHAGRVIWHLHGAGKAGWKALKGKQN